MKPTSIWLTSIEPIGLTFKELTVKKTNKGKIRVNEWLWFSQEYIDGGGGGGKGQWGWFTVIRHQVFGVQGLRV
jgi:hypothetical protein